jgi:hypothetical protein
MQADRTVTRPERSRSTDIALDSPGTCEEKQSQGGRIFLPAPLRIDDNGREFHVHLHRVTLLVSGAALAALFTVSHARAQRGDPRVDHRLENLTSNRWNCGAPGVACATREGCRFGVCIREGANGTLREAEEDERGDTGGRSAVLSWLADAFTVAAAPLTWSERGPELGGRLDAITRTGAARWVVGSPGGGLWRSESSGALWTFPHNWGYGDYSVVHLERDLIDPTRTFVMTWNGLYATSNSGDSVTALVNPGGVPAPLLPHHSTTDPKPFAQMRFSATERAVFVSPPCRGLLYALDGLTFKQATGAAGSGTCLNAIAADPEARRVWFATSDESSGAPFVYRSTCSPGLEWGPSAACDTWELFNAGLPPGSVVSALAFIGFPGSSHRLAAAVKRGATETRIYVYPSVSGPNGTKPSSVDEWEWQWTFGDPNWDPRALVATGFGPELFHGNVVPNHTPDLGEWHELTGGPLHPDIRALYADSDGRDSGFLWATTDGSAASGLYSNIMRWPWTPGVAIAPGSGTDRGHAGLTVWQAYYAAVTVRGGESQTSPGPRRVFLGSQDNGSLCSDTLGVGAGAWTPDGAPAGGGSADHFALQFAPSSPGIAYARSQSGDGYDITFVARGAPTCGLVSWETRTPVHEPTTFSSLDPPEYWSRHALAVHPLDHNRVYFALSDRIGVSHNGTAVGPTVVHQYVPAPPPGNAHPTALYVDTAGVIYVGTRAQGAFKCIETAPGLNCVPWGLNGPSPVAPELVTAITSNGATPRVFWMATTSGLFKGTEGPGALVSWVYSTGGGGYTVSDVEVDPRCPSRVYAALGFAFVYGQHRGGIRFSANSGSSWSSLTAGTALHQGPVTDVEVDPEDSSILYAASYGRGLWLYDWGTSLPRCDGRRLSPPPRR